MNLLLKFWRDESGAIISSEVATAGSVLVIGSVAGLSQLRDSVTKELSDTGAALQSISQSYSISGVSTQSASVAGSFYENRTAQNDARTAQPSTQIRVD